jgi:hypothetical protein
MSTACFDGDRSAARIPLIARCGPLHDGDFDTTADTTEDATCRNGGQPQARKSAYLSRLCNRRQILDTRFGGLWLRRLRVRAPSVTLPYSAKLSRIREQQKAHGFVAGGLWQQ